jgi:hypothetical protein
VASAPYSPRLRTAVVLCGAGTAGAYQAGALRALAEAGVKVDVVAGHGIGVATALGAAIDGGAGLWGDDGPWSRSRPIAAYRWRPALRLAASALAVGGLVLAAPALILVVAAAFYAAGLLAGLVNLTGLAERLGLWYRATTETLFSPPFIPTLVPRTLVLVLVMLAAVLAVAAWRAAREDGARRRFRGAFWWRLLGAPLETGEPAATLTDVLWRQVRGASHAPRPSSSDISQRYVETLADNLGQPGFRELIVAVHDVDARCDLVGTILGPGLHEAVSARRVAAGGREGTVIDLLGQGRTLVVDLLAGALRLPVASAPHRLELPAGGYWRGEIHRVCDRPDLVSRLLGDLAAANVEQVVLVSPAMPAGGPFGLRGVPPDLRGRLGEFARSIETAVLDDAVDVATSGFSGVFVIRPDHNPVGPFDFAGAYDEASDRRRDVADLREQGYADAYRQFIEPIVASGDRVEQLLG